MAIRMTVKKAIVNDAERLAFLKQEIAEMTKEFNKLKSSIDSEIGENTGIQAGSILIMKKPMTRRSLDRKSLLDKLGEEALKQCEKVTMFFQWHIEKA